MNISNRSFTNQILKKDNKVLENIIFLSQTGDVNYLKKQLMNFEVTGIESYYYYLLVNPNIFEEDVKSINFNELVKFNLENVHFWNV